MRITKTKTDELAPCLRMRGVTRNESSDGGLETAFLTDLRSDVIQAQKPFSVIPSKGLFETKVNSRYALSRNMDNYGHLRALLRLLLCQLINVSMVTIRTTMPKCKFFIFICSLFLSLAVCRPGPILAESGAPSEPSKIKHPLLPDQTEYFRYLHSAVKANMIWSQSSCDLFKGPKTVWEVTIKPDGTLAGLKAIESRGEADFDFAALKAIQKTFPVKPLPKSFEMENVKMMLQFSDYNENICQGKQKTEEKPGHEQQ